MWNDFINLVIAAATLAVTVVIYSLGRRIGLRATMERRAGIARELAAFRKQIHVDGVNSSLILMNAARYGRGDYTSYQDGGGVTLSWRGDLFVGGEFVGLRHDGFELLTGRSARGYSDSIEILFVPFDRVQWVNLGGDENFKKRLSTSRSRDRSLCRRPTATPPTDSRTRSAMADARPTRSSGITKVRSFLIS